MEKGIELVVGLLYHPQVYGNFFADFNKNRFRICCVIVIQQVRQTNRHNFISIIVKVLGTDQNTVLSKILITFLHSYQSVKLEIFPTGDLGYLVFLSMRLSQAAHAVHAIFPRIS